jgi:hypothetical protein
VAMLSLKLLFAKSEPKLKLNHIERPISTMDASLRCEDDVDYTCEEWANNVALNGLMYRLDNMQPISIAISQQYVDSQKEAMNLAVSIIMYHPSARLTGYIAKLGSDIVAKSVSESVAAGVLSMLLGRASSSLVDLQAGDILTFDGKGNVTQTRPGVSGTPGGSGGGAGGGSSGGSISVPGGSGKVVIACTGSAGKMVCKPIIV